MRRDKVRIIVLAHSHVAARFLQDTLSRDTCLEFSGSARDWPSCDPLLESSLPEVLMAYPGSIPPGWTHTSTSLLVVAESASMNAVTRGALPDHELCLAMEKELSLIYQDVLLNKSNQLLRLLQTYQRGLDIRRFATAVAARSNDGEVDVPVDQIEWIEGAGNSVRLHARGCVYSLREMISDVVADLPPSTFIRIHRSTVVNRAHVEQVITRDHVPTSVLTRSGVSLAVGITFREGLRKADLIPLAMGA